MPENIHESLRAPFPNFDPLPTSGGVPATEGVGEPYIAEGGRIVDGEI